MKLASILAAAMIAVAAPTVHAHAEHGQPQYGGIYGEAGTFQAELLIKDTQATIYLSNHDDVISSKGATGKLTILGADGKSEVELKPGADNQMTATLKAKPAKGTKVMATITLPGKKAANVRYVIE
jgi:copper(I)-binding protein